MPQSLILREVMMSELTLKQMLDMLQGHISVLVRFNDPVIREFQRDLENGKFSMDDPRWDLLNSCERELEQFSSDYLFSRGANAVNYSQEQESEYDIIIDVPRDLVAGYVHAVEREFPQHTFDVSLDKHAHFVRGLIPTRRLRRSDYQN